MNGMISIVLGGAKTNSCVVVRIAHMQVIGQSEKAVQLQSDSGESIWLPKKALKATGDDGCYALQTWMKLSGYQNHVLTRAQTISGISNA